MQSYLCLSCILSSLLLLPTAYAQTFAGGVSEQSKTVLVNAPAGHTISIFVMPAPLPAGGCTAANVTVASPLMIGAPSGTSTGVTYPLPSPPGAPPFAVALAQPLVAAEALCLEDLTAAPVAFGGPTTVGVSIVTPHAPVVVGMTVAASPALSSIVVQGASGDMVSIFQYPPSISLSPAAPPHQGCDPGGHPAANLSLATQLVLVTGSSPQTTGYSLRLPRGIPRRFKSPVN